MPTLWRRFKSLLDLLFRYEISTDENTGEEKTRIDVSVTRATGIEPLAGQECFTAATHVRSNDPKVIAHQARSAGDDITTGQVEKILNGMKKDIQKK